jgi:hypothetical protein
MNRILRRARLSNPLLWLVLLLAAPAAAGDFMDTRISFVISDANFFAGPGEGQVNNPGIGIGAGKQNTLFFDNYDTRFTGFESLSHLVLYKKLPSFFDNLTTEAALAIRFYIYGDTDVNKMIYDTGSYIRLSYDLSGGMAENNNLQLTLFPVSGDRLRLGYSYRISWGGSGIFPNYDPRVNVPAVKLQLNKPWGYAFLGAKTAQINEYLKDTNQTEMVTNYGLLAGFGVDIAGIRAEVNGGFFTRGTFAHQGVRGEHMYGGGVSYQLGYHQGMEIGSSIDFALYKNDPDIDVKFFKPEKYGEGLSFVVKHEGTFLFQTLIHPEKYGTTVNQIAYAFDVNAAMKLGYLRLHLDAMFRSLSYVLYETPSFTPFYDFPAGAKTKPEFFAAVGIDYHFPELHLTPGFTFGAQNPATYTIDNVVIGQAPYLGKRTVVVWDVATRSVLPVNEGAALIWSFKLNARWDISEMLAVVAEVFYTFDNNRVRYRSDFDGMNITTNWDDPNILGMNLVAQARF